MRYEDHVLNNLSTGLVALWPLGESSGAVVDITANAFASVAQAGLTYGQTGIPNTTRTAIRFTNAAAQNGQAYAQLEAAPGTRMRLGASGAFTVSVWFKRMAAGQGCSTGTGGITAEPLIFKGMAESETAGLNANYCLGLETLGSTLYLSADYEKNNTGNLTEKPTGRNGRMLDCSVASNVFTLRAHSQAAAAAAAHNYVDNDRVRFGGTAITGITAATWYFIVNANQGAGTFQVSSTQGGAALTGLGTVAAGGGAWFNHAKNTVTLATSDTNWHMAVLTWDGTNLRTYLDGVLAEHEVPTMAPPEDTSTQLCNFGCGQTSGGARTAGGGFNGVLQMGGFWTVALSSTQIQDAYYNGIAVPDSETSVGRAHVQVTNGTTLAGRAHVDPAAGGSLSTTRAGRAHTQVTDSDTVSGRAAVLDARAAEVAWAELLLFQSTATLSASLNGRAHVRISDSEVETGRAHVQVSDSETKAGRAHVQAADSEIRAGRAHVRVSDSETRNGRAHIASATSSSRTGRAHVRASDSETKAGRAHVKSALAAVLAGRATISGQPNRTLPGRATVRVSLVSARVGRARVGSPTARAATITGRAFVQKKPVTIIRGKAKIVVLRRYLTGARSVEIDPRSTYAT